MGHAFTAMAWNLDQTDPELDLRRGDLTTLRANRHWRITDDDAGGLFSKPDSLSGRPEENGQSRLQAVGRGNSPPLRRQ